MTAPSFKDLFIKFHMALARYYEDDVEPLYNPEKMKEFSERCAPGLFALIQESITNDDRHRTSTKREQQQLQRTVAIMHNLSFFRNQVQVLNRAKQKIIPICLGL